MTNYQLYRNNGSRCAAAQPLSAVSFGRFIYLALARWRERKRVKADLARLAEVGDHLLLDIGLDPRLARQDPAAALDQISNDHAGPSA